METYFVISRHWPGPRRFHPALLQPAVPPRRSQRRGHGHPVAEEQDVTDGPACPVLQLKPPPLPVVPGLQADLDLPGHYEDGQEEKETRQEDWEEDKEVDVRLVLAEVHDPRGGVGARRPAALQHDVELPRLQAVHLLREGHHQAVPEVANDGDEVRLGDPDEGVDGVTGDILQEAVVDWRYHGGSLKLFHKEFEGVVIKIIILRPHNNKCLFNFKIKNKSKNVEAFERQKHCLVLFRVVKMTEKPRQECVHIWVHSQNRQLTDFDLYS